MNVNGLYHIYALFVIFWGLLLLIFSPLFFFLSTTKSYLFLAGIYFSVSNFCSSVLSKLLFLLMFPVLYILPPYSSIILIFFYYLVYSLNLYIYYVVFLGFNMLTIELYWFFFASLSLNFSLFFIILSSIYYILSILGVPFVILLFTTLYWFF